MYQSLIINPGSTSTKIAIFEDETELLNINIEHSNEELSQYLQMIDQKDFRVDAIEKILHQKNFKIEDFDFFVGRGGLMKPIPGGTYNVDSTMIEDLVSGKFGIHASNLGAIISDFFATKYQKPAFIVDPVVVDEFQDVAYLSGLSGIERRSVFHALNQKAVARVVSDMIGKKYNNANLIVAHLGGGITVGAHHYGQVIDVNNGLDGEGPYSPNRPGSISIASTLQYKKENNLTDEEMMKLITTSSGLVSYLGTNDLRSVDLTTSKGRLIFKGMAYQIAKEIGEQAVVLKGNVDQIILSGGLAYSNELVQEIKSQVSWIANVTVIPGEKEMLALNLGGLRVMQGEELVKNYQKESEALANGERI